ncbi:Protein kinase domain-containing protein [Desulfonema limicola]|uniref:non-specific serine/threonine protein kinase n=1 Tax=Desulfonema limicola TaxID=45656 RepID=A0A975BBZ2_9BACT|nr:serine/threonine-protein kinase [Desulfonema limicola]QTA82518.1 Protein kinase domain-containing protein [Desulfonema limicola]
MTEERDFTGPVKLGKYMIRSELGKGAMGIVYEGFDPFIERPVALKTIRKDLLNSKESDNLLARFRREAQAAGRLNHPNIVAVYDYDEDQETAFIAMEFVQGHPLKEYFENNERFDLTDIVRIMSQILGALSYAHENGVVHRDIKPANIILTDNAQVKITDFGIAHIESSNLTQTGMIMGTPNYMSPEQFMGHRVDGRSDLFSAGVMLYQFVTGENPFDGRTMATIMHKVLSSEPVNPEDLNLHISPDLNAVIKKAIAKKPEDRFQNAEEFFTSINQALQNSSSGGVSSPPVVEIESDPGATVILSSPNTINPQAETVNSLNLSSKSAKSESVKNSILSDSGSQIKWLFAGLMIILLTAGGMFFLFSNKEKSYGYINIFTKPYAEMYIDEKFLGKTPKSGLKLPAGHINIRFINKSYNIDVTEQIHVKPDETVRVSFKWK